MVDVIPLVQRKYTRIRAESFGGGGGGELNLFLISYTSNAIQFQSSIYLFLPMHRPPQLHHTSEQCKRLKESEKETKKT